MACATLKRNLEWEAQLPAKRRRCAPFSGAASASPEIKVAEVKTSPFGETVSAPAKWTPERMAQEICDEIKRMHRRRQVRFAAGAGASCSSSSGSEGDASPPHGSRAHSAQRMPHRALLTFKQVRMICERMLRDQEIALRTEYESTLRSMLADQYQAFLRFNQDQIQRRPPPAACMPLGMDADHMHQDLVPSYLS